MMMIADKKAVVTLSGVLLHTLLKLPPNIEVLDVDVQLRGEGLPESCNVAEGGNPTRCGLVCRDLFTSVEG